MCMRTLMSGGADYVLAALVLVIGFAMECGAESKANRLTYLDEADPYYVSRTFPKLTTPMWIGEEGVEAVIILSIDDMSDPAKYATHLQPIFDHLKKIDDRTPVSILTNRPAIDDPQLETFIRQGISIDVHTITHPCPLFSEEGFAWAKKNVLQCTTLLNRIPGAHPVAFRMPCCDSLNTPSPRFYAGIFDQVGVDGSFLTIDSSIFNIITPKDTDLQREWVLDEDGKEKFRKYLPFPSFVNTIEDYHYPYVINKVCWEFPCSVPSDWEAQNINGENDPRSLADMKTAVDVAVQKQGVYTLVFHPHGWIENTQVVDLIDHAVSQYGDKVKFLTFREAQECIDQYLLKGHPLRNAKGGDNGVRLLDLNDDGYQDVLIGNGKAQMTRIWNPALQSWTEQDLPFTFVDSEGRDQGIRFGVNVDGSNRVLAYCSTRSQRFAYAYGDEGWVSLPEMVNQKSPSTSQRGRDRGLRFRDIDGDGISEMLSSKYSGSSVYQWRGEWKQLETQFPAGRSIVGTDGSDQGLRFIDLDEDGDEDIVYSNESGSGVYLFESLKVGWSDSTLPADATLPPITINGTNNGAWFHSDHLWVVNETTSKLPDYADRRSFDMLLGGE